MKTTALIIIALLGLVTTAQARPTPVEQPNRIKYLAHQLEEAAHHVHEIAEAYAHHNGYREDRALKALHQLDRQARHFHEQAERYYQDPHHTEGDYRTLVRTYRQAERALHSLHAYEHVYDDFYQVEVLIDELAQYYDYGGHYGYEGRDDEYGDHGRGPSRRPYRGRLGVSIRWQR